MRNHAHKPAKVSNFSLAFQQMCSMVAIGQTKTLDETLRELILQAMALLPEEKITNEHDMALLLNTLFGLQIAEHEIKYAFERLTSAGTIRLSDAGSFILHSDVKKDLMRRIDNTYLLENKVRDGWFDELKRKYQHLPHPEMWSALRNYLAQAFLRHGIQAVALLDSSIELDNIYSKSLLELLRESVKDLPVELQLDGKSAVSNFVSTVGQYPERATYIAQLADGAFSYFSLSSAPDIANELRRNLSPLVLFLDTNFLFGILDLTINPQIAVSNELIRVIVQHKFPFSLKRHVKTDGELLSSIQSYETDFLQKNWAKNISHAALTSRFLAGVELKYHQAYVETGIDVKSFFSPFHHADVLLDQKAIDKFGEAEQGQMSEQLATLISDYTDYLKRKFRRKTYKKIAHDMTLLNVVRGLRSDAKSTLDAGAIIITCDYSLYGFDWETSKAQGVMPCTVLPNLFWQILRPFIPSDVDFSKSFAQTFAIPEFRTISSGSAEACSKMINILAGYRDFPEETAARMLSNDILIEQLRMAESNEAFQNYVEAAIVSENEQLIGENSILSKKYELEQVATVNATDKLKTAEKIIRQQNEEVQTEREQRIMAEEAAQTERMKRLETEEKGKLITSIIISVLIGTILILAFEWLVYSIPLTWLINHPNSYSLQVSSDLFLGIIGFLIFVPKWRRYILIALFLPLLGILIPLLGGPNNP